MVLVNAFIFWSLKNRRRSKGWCHYYGPLCLTLTATPLIMADLVRHVLQDSGVWPECDRPNGLVWAPKCNWSSSQYKCNLPGPEHCIPNSEENLKHLAPMGIVFTIVFTYSGFICLFVGTLWNANIIKKCGQLREKWSELRSNPTVQDGSRRA